MLYLNTVKKSNLLIGTTLALSLFFAACDKSSEITVTFDTQGGSAVSTQSLPNGAKATQPDDPTRQGYAFAGWFTDAAATQRYDFDTPVTESLTLYAGWITDGFVQIPDEFFRAELKRVIPNAFDGDFLDTMHNDVQSLITLNVNNKTIASLEGIQYFPELRGLDCSNNLLTSLDMSGNPELETLICDSSRLTTLDLSANTALEGLACHVNRLTSLDVSACTKLRRLFCGDNKLTGLDLSNNRVLSFVWATANRLNTLDVSNSRALDSLYCFENNLRTLDVSSNTALQKLLCNDNQLTELNVDNNTRLRVLDCADNQMNALDVSNNTRLTTLYCENNLLNALNVSANTALEVLFCNDNQLDELNMTANTALTALFCQSNLLTRLDLSANTELDWLWCEDNQLTRLDIRGMRSVRVLSLPLPGLDITAPQGYNPIDTLLLHDNLKDHTEIQETKTNRGSKLTIEVYTAAAGSTGYTLSCADYDPTGTAPDKCVTSP